MLRIISMPCESADHEQGRVATCRRKAQLGAKLAWGLGDESDMLGASEMSSVHHSTTQGDEGEQQSKGALIAVTALALIVAVICVVVAFNVFESHESEETEESSGGSPPGSGGGPPGSGGGGPPAVNTPPSTTPRPKLLMCTTRYPGPRNNPPPHLCDMVVYDAFKTDLTNSPPQEVGFFKDYCKKKEAACGLNIDSLPGVLAQLDTPETKTVMADLYALHIKNYGLLRSTILATTKEADLKEQVDVLKKLGTFMNVTGSNRDTLFWGVSTPLGGATTPPDSMVQVFLGVLKAVPVNLVVYQTSYAENISTPGDKCISTGSAMWKSAPIPEQPTFEDSLNFWKAIRAHPPPGIAEMLAISLCGYWAAYGNNEGRAQFGIKTGCQYAYMDYLEDFICTGGPRVPEYEPAILEPISIQHISLKKTMGWTGGYDMNDTVQRKVCMASVNYGYDGGWVVHSLQCHFKEHCTGKNIGGFPRLRVVNDSMRRQFTTC